MSEIRNIPSSWLLTDVDDFAFLIRGITYSRNDVVDKHSEGFLPIFRANNIQENNLTFEDLVYVPKHLINEEQLILKGDIIFAMSSGSKHLVGKSAQAKKSINGSYGAFCALLRTVNSVSEKYLSYYFLGNEFRRLISEIAKGTNINNLKREHILFSKIPLPPLNEQHRIVSKTEELFSELDNGVANFKLAQKQLKVYRQALLKYAFEGKLTEQWRKENNPEPAEKLLERIKQERQNRYEQERKEWKAAVKAWENDGKKGRKPGKPNFKDINYQLSSSEQIILSSITETWLPTRLEAISVVITDGDHQAPPKAVKGIPFITISNIQNNLIDFTNTFFVDEKYYEGLPTYRKPIKGDVLYTVTGSFGIPVIIDFEYKFCFQRHIGLIRPLSSVNSKWLYYLLQTRNVFNQAAEMATGTAQKTVGLNSLRNFRISICAIEEQDEIVSILDSQFSIIDNLEKAIESGLKKSEALRQSILKKAFEGKLVPQDPNDEPASELLKRIQAEKKKYLEEQKQQKKRKPKNLKKMSKELSIEEVLKTSDKPMLAKDVWQKSKHKENIEDFYKELKDIQSKIKEIRKGTESLLSIVK